LIECCEAETTCVRGGEDLKLKLEDQDDGWFWDLPSIEVQVAAEAWVHSRLFYRVVFADPLELPEAGAPTLSGHSVATYPSAWLSPRWVGHEIRRDVAITTLLWLVPRGEQPDEPPRDVPHSARVGCREVGSLRGPVPA
jgi:hypothetical protein